MVARLLRLRLALLGAAFRGRPTEVARRILLGLLGVLAAVGLAWLPGAVVPGSTAAAAHDRAAIDTILGSAVLAIAVIVPFFANRRRLEPRQFGLLPETSGSVATAMLVTSPLSWAALWLLCWLVALGVLRPAAAAEPGWAFPAAAAIAFVFAVCGSAVSSALSKLIVPRRAGGTLRALGLLALVAALPVVIFAVAQTMRTPGSTVTADAADVLGRTPFGAPFAGASLAAAGDLSAAMARLGIGLLGLLVLLALWYAIVGASLRTIERPDEVAVTRDGLGWFDRVSARPAAVIGARSLGYWARDPRYRVALIAIPIAPIAMVVALMIAGIAPEVIALVPVPVILLLLGWSVHNDVAHDSTAIWLHVASGTRGRDDRFGRLMPVLLLGLPVVLVGSSVSVTIAGDWRLLPAVLGLNTALLLVACAASSVFSAVMPYPATRPGDSAFAQPSISGAGAGLAQTLSMLVALVLAVPPLWVSIAAIVDLDFGENVFALFFGVLYGLLVLVGGVLLGGWAFERRAPELVAATQMFD